MSTTPSAASSSSSGVRDVESPTVFLQRPTSALPRSARPHRRHHRHQPESQQQPQRPKQRTAAHGSAAKIGQQPAYQARTVSHDKHDMRFHRSRRTSGGAGGREHPAKWRRVRCVRYVVCFQRAQYARLQRSKYSLSMSICKQPCAWWILRVDARSTVQHIGAGPTDPPGRPSSESVSGMHPK